MLSITRTELCSRNGATLFRKYRARLLNASEMPVINNMSWMVGKEIVMIDRLPGSDCEIPLDTVKGKENISPKLDDHIQDYEEVDSPNDSKLGASPLKYEFLTLAKLEAKKNVLIDEYYYPSAMKRFFNSLKTSEARSLAGKLIADGVPFDAKTVSDPIIWISCDATDHLHTCLLGLCKKSSGTETYHVRRFPRNHTGSIKFLEDYMEHLYDSYRIYPDTAYCMYDVVPGTMTVDRDSQNKVFGFVELHVSWTFSNISRYSGGILSKPIPSASVIAKISPGWFDVRFPHLGLVNELELILALGRALRTGKMIWPDVTSVDDERLMKSSLQSLLSQTSTFPENKNLQKNIGLEEPHDFTEELWLLLHYCKSSQSLTEALKCVFDALKSGYKNTLVLTNNKCTMARLLRDACTNELLLPRLEGLTPVQIYLEMGLERLRRACMDEFLNRGYFESVAEINDVFDCCTRKDPQDQADALFLFYNSLLIVNTCKQYFRLDRHHINIIARQVLGQYNKLNISPTADDLTQKMVEEMTFILNCRLSFADIFKPVHKNRLPKIWKSEVTVETTNKQGWIARSMILCSRTTSLPFIKNPEAEDAAFYKQNPVGEDIVDFNSSEKNEGQAPFQSFIPQTVILYSTNQEKLELDSALRHYEVTVATGSLNVPFSRS